MVNRNKDYKQEDSELIVLLNEMYESLDMFCIILLLNEEQIDEKYTITESKQAVDVFLQSLNWESPRGILISKGV